MVPKLLAWIAFSLVAVFAAIALATVFARESLGELGPTLLFYGGMPLLGLAILVSVTLLVLSAFRS